MILGMLALGTAMETTGAAHLIASVLTGAVGHFGPAVTLSVTYLVATLLTELISNNAVAVLLTPIAFEIAATMGVDARPFAVAVMFGCAASSRPRSDTKPTPTSLARVVIASPISRRSARRSISFSGS